MRQLARSPCASAPATGRRAKLRYDHQKSSHQGSDVMTESPILRPSRRSLLKVAGGLAGAAALPMPFIRRAHAAGTTQLAISLRSLTNPYHADFAKGGQNFAKSVGQPIEVLVTEGNSEK